MKFSTNDSHMRLLNFDLTPRESQILTLIGEAQSTKEIAHALGISPWTVGTHRKRICAKLGVHTTAELVAFCAGEGVRDTAGTRRAKAEVCHLAVDFRGGPGRVQFHFSGRLRRTPGVVTVRIGRETYYF